MISKEWREREKISPAMATVSAPEKHAEGEPIDLTYLDPPFKSNKNNNVLSLLRKVAPEIRGVISKPHDILNALAKADKHLMRLNYYAWDEARMLYCSPAV